LLSELVGQYVQSVFPSLRDYGYRAKLRLDWQLGEGMIPMRQKEKPRLQITPATYFDIAYATPSFDFEVRSEPYQITANIDYVDSARPASQDEPDPNLEIPVDFKDLEAIHTTAEQVINEILALAEASPSGSHAGLEDFRNVMQALIAAPRVGKPAKLPVYDDQGCPILRGKLGAIWQKYLDADRAIAEAVGKEWTPRNICAPWSADDLDTALINMLHYPTPDQPPTACNTISRSTRGVNGKLGLGDVRSPTAQQGVTSFDVQPRMTSIAEGPNIPNVLPYQLEMVTDIWDACTARVGLVWGVVPRQVYQLAFGDRIHLVQTLPFGANLGKEYIYYEYRSQADHKAGKVSRITFCVPHPSNFCRFSSRVVTPSSHSLMAIERLVDAATLVAYCCIPRPCFLSRGFWLSCSVLGLAAILEAVFFLSIDDKDRASGARDRMSSIDKSVFYENVMKFSEA
jgi:hypothetical protein